jgi:hypothetical protein
LGARGVKRIGFTNSFALFCLGASKYSLKSPDWVAQLARAFVELAKLSLGSIARKPAGKSKRVD